MARKWKRSIQCVVLPIVLFVGLLASFDGILCSNTRTRWPAVHHHTVESTPSRSPPPPSKTIKALQGVEDTKIMFLLHLHKSGGSTMCRIAAANGEIAKTHNNCNVQQDQRCCGGDTLEAHEAFAKTTKYTFVANERHMYEAMDRAHFEYVVVLRDSRARYYSHWRHVRRTAKIHVEPFTEWLLGQPDNWNLRQLCGTRCMNVPKFQLTHDHVSYARERLARFDHVLRMDMPGYNFTRDVETLARSRGWTKPLDAYANRARPGPHTPVPDVPIMMTYLDDALALNLNVHIASHESNYTHPCGKRCTAYK